MHELGLMEAVVTAVAESAVREGITRVRTVRLVVGQRLGALPDALRFAFEVLAAGGPAEAAGVPGERVGTASEGDGGTAAGGRVDILRRLFQGASLEIEERPTRARCRTCGLEYGEQPETAVGVGAEPRRGAGAPEAGAPDAGLLEAGTLAVGVGWVLPCPRCGAPAPEILSGNELLVDSYEGDQDFTPGGGQAGPACPTPEREESVPQDEGGERR